MFNLVLNILAGSLLILSFFRDRQKTIMALKKAWKSFENILPQLLAIFMIIGISLSLLSPETISYFIGERSGFIGVMLASVIGSVTLIPGFIAFPLVAALKESGAGIAQLAVFVSTLMMVGIVTLPLEIKYFGKKAALLRNGQAFLFSFIVAWLMEVILA